MSGLETFQGRLPAPPDWTLDLAHLEGEPWAAAMRASTQDPVLHAEGDVWTHTVLVLEALVTDPVWRALDTPRRDALFWAALLHDVAKPQTRTEEGGRIGNPGHARIGSLEARAMLWRAGVDRDVREAACAIIAIHQAPFWLKERPTWQAEHLLAALALQAEPEDAVTHARADVLGRVCPDQARLLDAVGIFGLMAKDMGARRPGTQMFANDHARVRYFTDPERWSWREAPPDMTSPEFEVVALSGLPGSGKSTVAAALAAERGLPVLSLDGLRKELGLAPGDKGNALQQQAQERAHGYLRARRSFVWDSTNLTREQRRRVLGLAHAYGARSRVVCVERSWAETMRGNQDREAVVPPAAMERMLRTWEPPTLAECHALEVVRPHAAPDRNRRE